MAYATLQNLIDRFGETTVITSCDRDGDGVVDADAVARALDDASSMIDGYLAKRHTLPLTTVPDVLVRIACEMALYLVSFEAGPATEEKKARYDAAIKFLTAVSNGTVALSITEPASASSPTAPELRGPRRQFTRNSLKGIL